MTGRASPRSLRRLERGGVTWVGLLLILGVIGAGYMGWVWVPLWVERYMVKQTVREYMNQAIKNPADDALRANLAAKLRALESIPGVDAYGRATTVPAVDVDERAITWERSTGEPPTLRIAFEYERQVVYPFLDRTDVAVFSIDMTGDLALPNWGPAR